MTSVLQRSLPIRHGLEWASVFYVSVACSAARFCVQRAAAASGVLREPTSLPTTRPPHVRTISVFVLLGGNTEHFLARWIDELRTVVSRFQLTDEKPTDGCLTDGRLAEAMDGLTFAIGSEFFRHALDDSAPIADLQGNKKRIPYCEMCCNTGATANEQTSTGKWAERLDCLRSTKTNRDQTHAGSLPDFCKWESCQTMPLIGRFSGVSFVPPDLAFWRCSILFSFHPHRLTRPQVNEVRMEQNPIEEMWETGDSRVNPLTCGIARHDSHMRRSGVNRAGERTRFASVGGEQSNRSASSRSLKYYGSDPTFSQDIFIRPYSNSKFIKKSPQLGTCPYGWQHGERSSAFGFVVFIARVSCAQCPLAEGKWFDEQGEGVPAPPAPLLPPLHHPAPYPGAYASAQRNNTELLPSDPALLTA
ncbi:hypothetical protein PR048_012162 [Dryococelus australis]|uniref:Uncharacterized protein n=1 Tax=Dryococelus australis TaxID=614101 RepID=A0ABQ9HNR9_9NEOP|nr:hypothetical protein PR048_012162 [Dryococelus australis]